MSYESRWRKYFLIKFLLCVCKNHVFIAAIGKNGMTEGKKCSKQQQQWWWWWQPDYRKPGELKTFIAHLHVTWPSIAQHPIHYSQVLTAHQQRRRRRSHAPPAPAAPASPSPPFSDCLLETFGETLTRPTPLQVKCLVFLFGKMARGDLNHPQHAKGNLYFHVRLENCSHLCGAFRWEEMENYQQNHNSDNENRIYD